MVFRTLVLGLLGAISLQLAFLPHELGHVVARPDDAPPAVIHVSKDALDRYGEIELPVFDGVTNRRVRLVLEP